MCGILHWIFHECQRERAREAVPRAATAGKAPKAWALPRFWISIRSYKKQPVKKIWDRILGLAWLKFAVAPLDSRGQTWSGLIWRLAIEPWFTRILILWASQGPPKIENEPSKNSVFVQTPERSRFRSKLSYRWKWKGLFAVVNYNFTLVFLQILVWQ